MRLGSWMCNWMIQCKGYFRWAWPGFRGDTNWWFTVVTTVSFNYLSKYCCCYTSEGIWSDFGIHWGLQHTDQCFGTRQDCGVKDITLIIVQINDTSILYIMGIKGRFIAVLIIMSLSLREMTKWRDVWHLLTVTKDKLTEGESTGLAEWMSGLHGGRVALIFTKFFWDVPGLLLGSPSLRSIGVPHRWTTRCSRRDVCEKMVYILKGAWTPEMLRMNWIMARKYAPVVEPIWCGTPKNNYKYNEFQIDGEWRNFLDRAKWAAYLSLSPFSPTISIFSLLVGLRIVGRGRVDVESFTHV